MLFGLLPASSFGSALTERGTEQRKEQLQQENNF